MNNNFSRRHFLAILGGGALLAGLSACTTADLSDQETQEDLLATLRAEGKYKEQKIEIGDNFYKPQVAEIQEGTIVIWENKGRMIHDVVWDDRLSNDTTSQQDFTSETLRSGNIHVWLFDEPGTFNYHCKFHGGPGRGHWGSIKVSSTDRSPSPQE